MKKTKYISVMAALGCAISLTGCGMPISQKQSGEAISIETVDEKATATDANASVSSKDLFEDEAVNAKISEIEKYIDEVYYFDTDKDRQEEAIYDGIMEGLDDPYSVYYTKEEYESLMEEDSGEYSGIGAVVTQDEEKRVSIVRPFSGSPAEEAGLQAEDIIVSVDGVTLVDMELEQAVKLLKGPEGTKVHLKIYRAGEPDYIEVDVTRRVIENSSVSSEVLEGNIGYIQVEQFYQNTDETFIEQYAALEEQGVKGIIVDLRDNPGGLVDTVVNMCDYIMESGTIVSIKDKNDKVIADYKATDNHVSNIPMVVLVNGNSASASEIFTGAMKDTGKAKVVGTTTFGKGIVQSLIKLSDGSAIKVTIAKYFTPNGNDIHKLGIEPDYVVELEDGRTNAVNLERDKDTQLQKAIELLNE